MKVSLFPNLIPLLVIVLSACGSGNDGPKARMGQSGNYVDPTETERKRIPENAALPEGHLSVLSDADIQEAKGEGKLPFATTHKPGWITLDGGTMNTGANLVFRAIRQVPPKEAITKVTKFRLKLSGLNVYEPAGFEGVFSDNQILCFLDGKACIGAVSQSEPQSRESHEKVAFLKSARILSEDWLTSTRFLPPTDLGEGAKLHSASGEQVVDFLGILNDQNAAQIVDFILAHSEPYSEEAHGYRKFRFVAGDRVFFSSGSLELEFETDSSRIPTNFSNSPPTPLKGGSDQVYSRDLVETDASPLILK
jgi:hypothetical protein